MEELYRNLMSLSWWLGVVLVGLIMNLASAYLKSPLDALLSRINGAWRSRSERTLAKRRKLVSSLRRNAEARMDMLAIEMRFRFIHLASMLLAIFLLLFSLGLRASFPSPSALAADVIAYWTSKTLYYVSAFVMLWGVQQHYKAIAISRLLNEATRQATDQEAEPSL